MLVTFGKVLEEKVPVTKFRKIEEVYFVVLLSVIVKLLVSVTHNGLYAASGAFFIRTKYLQYPGNTLI